MRTVEKMENETQAWKPHVYHDTRKYWEGCARKELWIARCQDCGWWLHPPRGVCPKCWSDNIGHEQVSGRAKVFTYIVLGKDRPGAGGARVTLWAELVEQPRLIVVADRIGGDEENLAIGDDLVLDWRDHMGFPVPVFRRVD
jgi:hypothetical protein